MARVPCGKHIELSSNDTVRVTRCPCGTVHVTLLSQGVTVRMNDEMLRGATRGLMSALDKVEESEPAGPPIN